MTSTRLRLGGRVRHKRTKAWANVTRIERRTTTDLLGTHTEVVKVALLFDGARKTWPCPITVFNANYLCL